MLFRAKLLTVFVLQSAGATLAATRRELVEDGTNAAACGQDRCARILIDSITQGTQPLTKYGNPYVYAEPYRQWYTNTEFEANVPFSFASSREVLCNTCLKKLPSDWESQKSNNDYVKIWNACDGKVADPSGPTLESFNINIKYENGPFIYSDVPTYTRILASFFDDTPPLATDSGDVRYCVRNFENYVDPCCLDSVSPTLSSSPSVAPSISMSPSVAPSISMSPSARPTTPVPTNPPSLPPSAPPTTEEPEELCFSSVASVDVQGKGQTTMKFLEVGDYVLTPHGYEKVYTIDHRNENKVTDFLAISTGTQQVLEVTPGHLIYLYGKEDPVEAKTIQVGDTLQSFGEGKMSSVSVEKVSTISRSGLYNPITSSGTIVVDGLVTSTYTAFPVTDGSNYLRIGGFKVISMHDFMHVAMSPFKMICTSVSNSMSKKFCTVAEGNEHNTYNKLGLKIMAYGSNQTIFVRNLIVVSLVTMFIWINILSNPVFLAVLTILFLTKSKISAKKN